MPLQGRLRTTFAGLPAHSGLTPETDIVRAGRHVSKVLTGHSRRPPGLNIQENPPASNHVADVRHDATRALSWKLVRENVELVNLRRFGKQVASLCFFHQGRRHLAVEVGIATAASSNVSK